jgi:hypothetical protein
MNWDFLKPGGPHPNIPGLKNAVERLILATTQKNAGQRKDSTPDNSVIWQSSELEMIQWIIVCEAVALYLSGKLDEMER